MSLWQEELSRQQLFEEEPTLPYFDPFWTGRLRCAGSFCSHWFWFGIIAATIGGIAGGIAAAGLS